MVFLCFRFTLADFTVADRCLISKGLIEHDNKVVLEILGNTSAVTGGITDDLIFFGNDLDIRTTVESIDNHIRLIRFGKSKTKHGGTFCRRDFRDHIMIGQINTVIIRFGHFRLMGKPAGTLILVEHHLTGYRHDGKLTVIVYPGTGLVCLLEPPYLVGIIGIGPAVSHLSGLRHPEIHTPRHCNRRIGISCGQGYFRLGADQGIHVIHQFGLIRSLHREKTAAKGNSQNK